MKIKYLLFIYFLMLPVSVYAADIEYINAQVIGNKKPKVKINTNLPDGLELAVDINKIGGGYADGYNIKIKNGEVLTNEFTKDGGPLPSGEYMVMILTAGAAFLPENIQKIIGENGENLIGPDVRDSSVGVGNVIDKRFVFSVP
jgi:hypothetical protein